MKKIIFIFCLLSCFNVFAQSERLRLINAIKEKSQVIDRSILSVANNISTQELRELDGILDSGLDVLRLGGDHSGNQSCIDFAYEIYNVDLSRADAMAQAQKNCVGMEDVYVARFAYDIYNRDYTRRNSMDRALSISRGGVRGKSHLLQFAFEKHNRYHPRVVSLSKSIENIRIASLGRGLECFEKYFAIHNRTASTSQAMDNTAESCR